MQVKGTQSQVWGRTPTLGERAAIVQLSQKSLGRKDMIKQKHLDTDYCSVKREERVQTAKGRLGFGTRALMGRPS